MNCQSQKEAINIKVRELSGNFEMCQGSLELSKESEKCQGILNNKSGKN